MTAADAVVRRPTLHVFVGYCMESAGRDLNRYNSNQFYWYMQLFLNFKIGVQKLTAPYEQEKHPFNREQPVKTRLGEGGPPKTQCGRKPELNKAL